MTRSQLKNHIVLGIMGPAYSAQIEVEMLPKDIAEPEVFLANMAWDCGCYIQVVVPRERWNFSPDNMFTDRMADAIEEYNEIHHMRGIEMTLAYERAAMAIENECVRELREDRLDTGWYDLESADSELDDEVAYLESRRLLERHPEHPEWVTICDEGEPLPEVAG